MKKFILFFIALLLSACASTPQVTVTSEVTVTLTLPSETPTPAIMATNTQTAAATETVTIGMVSEAMQTATDLLDRYSVDPETVTITEMSSVVIVTDNESGKVIYKDGSWDPLFLGNLLVDGGHCKITPWTESKVGRAMPDDLQAYTAEYGQPLTDAYLLFVKKRIIPNTGNIIRIYYIGDGCWGQVYYNRDDQPDAWFFWKDINGKALYERVFLTLNSE